MLVKDSDSQKCAIEWKKIVLSPISSDGLDQHAQYSRHINFEYSDLPFIDFTPTRVRDHTAARLIECLDARTLISMSSYLMELLILRP